MENPLDLAVSLSAIRLKTKPELKKIRGTRASHTWVLERNSTLKGGSSLSPSVPLLASSSPSQLRRIIILVPKLARNLSALHPWTSASRDELNPRKHRGRTYATTGGMVTTTVAQLESRARKLSFKLGQPDTTHAMGIPLFPFSYSSARY